MRRNLYVININRRRNYYSCRGFGHLARNCRSWGIVVQGRRMEYRNNINNRNNLKEKESLIVLN